MGCGRAGRSLDSSLSERRRCDQPILLWEASVQQAGTSARTENVAHCRANSTSLSNPAPVGRNVRQRQGTGMRAGGERRRHGGGGGGGRHPGVGGPPTGHPAGASAGVHDAGSGGAGGGVTRARRRQRVARQRRQPAEKKGVPSDSGGRSGRVNNPQTHRHSRAVRTDAGAPKMDLAAPSCHPDIGDRPSRRAKWRSAHLERACARSLASVGHGHMIGQTGLRTLIPCSGLGKAT